MSSSSSMQHHQHDTPPPPLMTLTSPLSSPSSHGQQLGHKCHMCGRQFARRESLISHIEEHKKSGIFMYNPEDGKNSSAFQQRLPASGEESESESESEGSDETQRGKSTIHFGMKGGHNSSGNHQSDHRNNHHSHPSHHQHHHHNNNGNGRGSSLDQVAERAMALRMLAANNRQNSEDSGSGSSSSNNTNNNHHHHTSNRPGVIHSSMSTHNNNSAVPGDGGAGESEDGRAYYSSAPVFPGQIGGSRGSHATPYHAAAQQFQNSDTDYTGMDGAGGRGSNPGPGNRMGGYSASSIPKGLPGFDNFRHQLGGYGGERFHPDYPTNLPPPPPSSDQFSPRGTYSNSSALPVSSSAYLSAAADMAASYSSSSSVPVYPDMSVFPGMPMPRSGGSGDGMGGPMGRGNPPPPSGDLQQQYEPLLQFQPLSS